MILALQTQFFLGLERWLSLYVLQIFLSKRFGHTLFLNRLLSPHNKRHLKCANTAHRKVGGPQSSEQVLAAHGTCNGPLDTNPNRMEGLGQKGRDCLCSKVRTPEGRGSQ